MKRKWMVGLTLAAMLALTTACGNKFEYTVSISQVVEHPSLDATRQGFLAALKDAGIVDGENLKVDYNNAQGDAANGKSIAQKIATGKSDLALGIATMPSQHLATEVKNKPVLFAAVTDPLDAGIVTNLEKPGGNVSGMADTNPRAVIQTMDFIAAEFPNIKTIGLIINTGEPNAVIMAEIAEEALKPHGIAMVRAAVSNSSEVKQAAESLIDRADALFVTLDNEVVSAVDAIIDVANSHDIPFFASDRDSVEAGALLAYGFKYFDHGYEVGQMAVEILKNGKNPGEMPISVPQKLDFIINTKAAAEQGVEITDAMKAYVKNPDENLLQ